MKDDDLHRLVEECWTALEAEETKGEHRLRVSLLPSMADRDPLAVGVDHNGHRHLLVPVPMHRKVRSGLDGPVLQLRKRPLEDTETYQMYADLACLRTDLNDLFTELCVDAVGAAEKLPENPVKALYRVLDRWRALFQTQGTPLGPEQLAGLFGELLVLEQLLERDSSAHRLWRGPSGHHHDFSSGSTAVEVKTSTVSEGRRPRIHGLDQLDAPEGGALHLAWFRLHRTAKSNSSVGFLELLDRVLRRCDDESTLLELLAEAGYRVVDAEQYRDTYFKVDEERWYEVVPSFPKLTALTLGAAGVTISVVDVEYTIDLSGDSPTAMDSDEVSRAIDRMIQESA
ncbi:PD-(D/E)XK motif protein [Streptomyces sp. NPDC088794]|uniref:PD-(D/E)XK motif protein n=1 Tax=Streptomyces sp. NPDC088794 TaxID=3365902 RepID=UPI0038216657